MSGAIVIENKDGKSTLNVVDIAVNAPESNEVKIRHTAIEVNYVDVQHFRGIYPIQSNLKIPGISAVGTIVAAGSEATIYKIGDKVGYISEQSGSYCQERCIDQKSVFLIPKEIPDKVAAACVAKGLTAHYLATRTFLAKRGTSVLVHAAAGGVGQLLTQWCNNMGAYVIGTVGSDSKKKLASESGCHEVINYNTEDWITKIKDFSKGWGVNAVYDSVGKTTYDGSLEVLSKMGILVLYGATSGKVDNINVSKINEKSLFITSPSLFHYKINRKELILSANELFNNLKDGNIKVRIQAELPLVEAAKAFSMLESRDTMGSIILIP